MKALLLSYSFPPQRFPRAIQVAHLARHSALPLEVVAVDDGEAGDVGLAATLPEALQVRRIPWQGRAALERALRDHTLKDRAYMPDPFTPWARAVARRLISERAVGPRGRAGELRPADVRPPGGRPNRTAHRSSLDRPFQRPVGGQPVPPVQPRRGSGQRDPGSTRRRRCRPLDFLLGGNPGAGDGEVPVRGPEEGNGAPSRLRPRALSRRAWAR